MGLPGAEEKPRSDLSTVIGFQSSMPWWLITFSPLIVGLWQVRMPGIRNTDIQENVLEFNVWYKIPLNEINVHLWITGAHHEVLFTVDDLRKLYLRMGNPFFNKLHAFLEKVRSDRVFPTTRALIQDTVDRSRSCQESGPKSRIVKVSVPCEHVMFSQEVIVDIMYINGHTVLHAVDIQNPLSILI